MAGKKINRVRKRNLKGSSIVEAVTASVIFLLLFTIALQSVVGMSGKEVRATRFIEADKAYRKAIRECTEGVYATGRYSSYFEWGRMEVCLEPYGDRENLLKISVTVCPKNNSVQVIHRHIIKPVKTEGI